MNSSEIISLIGVITGVLTPIALVGIGYLIDRRLKAAERQREKDKDLSQVRFELYKDIGFKLNDLFAYFTYVGLWKYLSCNDVLLRKRELDRHMYTYEYLFSPALFESYKRFMSEAFEMFQGMGEDAKLRTSAAFRKEGSLLEKHGCFTGVENYGAIAAAYTQLMRCLATDLDLAPRPYWE